MRIDVGNQIQHTDLESNASQLIRTYATSMGWNVHTATVAPGVHRPIDEEILSLKIYILKVCHGELFWDGFDAMVASLLGKTLSE